MKRSTAWKAFERRAAVLFSGIRNAFSGAAPAITGTRADVKHDRLFIECKWRQQHAVMSLWRATADKARREFKVPVLCLAEKGKAGCLIAFHSDDLVRLSRPDDYGDLPLFSGHFNG